MGRRSREANKERHSAKVERDIFSYRQPLGCRKFFAIKKSQPLRADSFTRLFLMTTVAAATVVATVVTFAVVVVITSNVGVIA